MALQIPPQLDGEYIEVAMSVCSGCVALNELRSKYEQEAIAKFGKVPTEFRQGDECEKFFVEFWSRYEVECVVVAYDDYELSICKDCLSGFLINSQAN